MLNVRIVPASAVVLAFLLATGTTVCGALAQTASDEAAGQRVLLLQNLEQNTGRAVREVPDAKSTTKPVTKAARRHARLARKHHAAPTKIAEAGASEDVRPAAEDAAPPPTPPHTPACPEAQCSIIIVSAEPGAVVTSTEPESTKVELAKPEPAEPAGQQVHAPGGWLIQIGAFDGEDEARQHLSEAQLKASTVLAAADPFTERVQKGDKALYRARFAGFDKETAEVACRQLKRSHFECVALKS
jgi:D-alanyl-D-alanine carboxypeptidase